MEEQERDSLRVDVKNAYAERFKATVDSAATAVDSEHSRAIRPLDSTDEKLYNAGGDSGAHPSPPRPAPLHRQQSTHSDVLSRVAAARAYKDWKRGMSGRLGVSSVIKKNKRLDR